MLADAFGPNICVWVSEIQGNICVDKQRAPHDFLTNGGRARAWLIYQAPSFVELSAIQQANHIHTHTHTNLPDWIVFAWQMNYLVLTMEQTISPFISHIANLNATRSQYNFFPIELVHFSVQK